MNKTVDSEDKSTQSPPLAGVRVVDLSRVLAGPLATMQLADLGADVVKIESPKGGDETRQWGPPWWRSPDGPMSAYFSSINRNKRSLAVNLKSSAGQDIVRALVRQGDVFVENFVPGHLEKWGLGFDRIRELQPRIVYCSITGFRTGTPLAERPGYDSVIQAMSGLMSVTGDPTGAPQKVGVAISDVLTGLYASVAIVAALRKVERGGPAQHLQLSLFDSQVAALVNVAGNYLCSGQTPKRFGNAHPNIVPYQVFPAADGHFMLAVGNDRQFQRLCQLMGLQPLADDDRFSTNPARVQNREKLIALLSREFSAKSTSHWVELLNEGGVPAGPIQDVAAALSSAQALESGLIREAGGIRFVSSPFRSEGTTVADDTRPPRLGEHTDQVLTELGYPPDAVLRLRKAGVVA